ncbi:MAG: glucosidase [Myxococcota bacterium]|nr:glucosidase [Myxococcota bacterium]
MSRSAIPLETIAPPPEADDPEWRRLQQDAERSANWKRWGTYLPERQWGTVREDYSADGSCWTYFPFEQAASRVYRWGEDGLLGLCDRQGRLCFAIALWNERDPILKERLFGLGGLEGNHGEDVKELYYYLAATPTCSYARALYKYPQRPFPYAELRDGNARRSRFEPELEILDTEAFVDDRYFDVTVEYAKAAPDDVLIRITIDNRGPDHAPLHVLPTLWFRNTWAWGRQGEGYPRKPLLEGVGPWEVRAEHEELGEMRFVVEPAGEWTELLFTENETNTERLWGVPSSRARHFKDAFHEAVVRGRREALCPEPRGTRCAAHCRFQLGPRGRAVLRARLLSAGRPVEAPFEDFDAIVERRRGEHDRFYELRLPPELGPDERAVCIQAYAGLLWTKQFYYYVVEPWLEGDPGHPPPPETRRRGRNADWKHLYNRDVLSMPDKWEYPWYAAWDLAFHVIPMARIDPWFAKEQLVLLLREWYMHPSGQIPAYEFAFGDVNPPVHAWAAWRVYKMTGRRGERDRTFLARVFQKLLLNFTWWVNRKDDNGDNLFAGGFLGLDNIGVFDRSQPLPTGGRLEQADGTAWMAFYAATMLSIALELADGEPAYEDMASKFFEHFVAIVDAMNHLGGTGLWDEADGFYYDQLHVDGRTVPLRVRSLVGLVPLLAVEVLDGRVIDRLPGFRRRMQWFLEHRADLARHVSYMQCPENGSALRLLAVPSRARLLRVLRYVLDENEFLSPYGIRSLSRYHARHPYVFTAGGREYRVEYAPGESTTAMFGGNSNWRGPIWFPLNYLLVEALERYDHFWGETLRVECPTGSGRWMRLSEVAAELERRLGRLFLPDADGRRPCHGHEPRYATDPAFRDLVLFYEYFHGETGRGCGASHQTGWTALVARCLEDAARRRARNVEERTARSTDALSESAGGFAGPPPHEPVGSVSASAAPPSAPDRAR